MRCGGDVDVDVNVDVDAGENVDVDVGVTSATSPKAYRFKPQPTTHFWSAKDEQQTTAQCTCATAYVSGFQHEQVRWKAAKPTMDGILSDVLLDIPIHIPSGRAMADRIIAEPNDRRTE